MWYFHEQTALVIPFYFALHLLAADTRQPCYDKLQYIHSSALEMHFSV